MKTTRSARRLVRFRAAMLALALIAITALELGAGGILAARIRQTSGSGIDAPQPPVTVLYDVMAGASPR